MTPSITQDNVNTALGNFLVAILGLPSGQIIVGQVNRVAEPEGDFAVMWPLRRPRLGTNVDTATDAKFTGSIAATVMTITEVFAGEMNVGATVFGVGVAANTIVEAQLTGTPGGVGTYTVGPSQTVGSTMLSAGAIEIDQSTEVVMQIDVYGPLSADNAQTISTLLRDPYGVSLFDGTGVSPLYADEPRQVPFLNAASQFEDRWIVEAHLQIVPVISIPQEFASQATVDVVDVNATYH
jgi:hypothetical protein